MEQTELTKLFEMAIGREIEAYTFYSGVARRVQDKPVKELFEQLASEEKGHEEALRKFQSDPASAATFNAPADYKVAESVALPEVTIDMKPADAIALAMKKEQQAVEFYTQLAEWCSDATIKGHYENLAAMELNHKHRLESMFVDIGYPEAW